MQYARHKIVRIWSGPTEPEGQPFSCDPGSNAAPTVQEVSFETAVTLAVALGIGLIAQILLGSL